MTWQGKKTTNVWIWLVISNTYTKKDLKNKTIKRKNKLKSLCSSVDFCHTIVSEICISTGASNITFYVELKIAKKKNAFDFIIFEWKIASFVFSSILCFSCFYVKIQLFDVCMFQFHLIRNRFTICMMQKCTFHMFFFSLFVIH